VNKSFKDVIGMLKDGGEKKFTHMRFLSSKYALSDSELTSMGSYGKFTMHEVKKHMQRERRLLLINRNKEFEGTEDPAALDKESDDESVNSGDESSSEDESDFDDDMRFLHAKAMMKSEIMDLDTADTPSQTKAIESAISSTDKPNESNNKELTDQSPDIHDDGRVARKQETTRSLALRLLDIDIGYSSDEGGDENNAYYIDGVDCTFATSKNYKKVVPEGGKDTGNDDGDKTEAPALPVKKREFSSIGDRAKLISAISLSQKDVEEVDFENYPLPSSVSVASNNTTKETNHNIEPETVVPNDLPPLQLSKTKIEQVSISSNEVIRVWASVEDASATLQIPLKDLKEVLKGEYSDDTGDEVSGFKWRYAPENAEVTKLISDKEKDKGKKAFYEFRDKLYDHEKPHMYKGGNRLRDYQIDGINWLASCWYKRHGYVLKVLFIFYFE
jgi:hypothetical protein